MRHFEKVSYEEFKKYFGDNKTLYEEYNIPRRQTKHSAGYDFESLSDYIINPNESVRIPLCIKAQMYEDEVLMLYVRSSMGFKYNVRMCNQVGIIDSDYYNNIDNEGNIFIKLKNEGDIAYNIKKGDKVCQGIFTKFLTTENEEKIDEIRNSGIGSTNGGKNGK